LPDLVINLHRYETRDLREYRMSVLREFMNHPDANLSCDNEHILRTVIFDMQVTRQVPEPDKCEYYKGVEFICLFPSINPFEKSKCRSSVTSRPDVNNIGNAYISKYSAIQLTTLCRCQSLLFFEGPFFYKKTYAGLHSEFCCMQTNRIIGAFKTTTKFKIVVEKSVLILRLAKQDNFIYIPIDIVGAILIAYYFLL
jgi:hypothetical protein